MRSRLLSASKRYTVAAPAAIAHAGPWVRSCVRVARDAVLRGDLRSGHLEQVELAGHLKQRVPVLGVAMEFSDVGNHGRHAHHAAMPGGDF
ncbi:MAG TPA: hypothetical protein VNR64_08130 [Vicinamibacterales bacterium]|nr:hypothetical protein [Vicinamibacterales bacterium]